MSAIPADLPISSPWRRALPALLLLWAVLLLLYRDTAVAMVQIWARSDTFAHAFLVPPIALWLAWRKRDVLATMQPSPQPWALLPMAAIGLLWLLGELATVNAATQFALVALLVLAVPAVLGTAVARELTFPLGFLFFAVPFGEFMTPHMIGWTADATIMALRWTGIPVYREGMQFVIPSGHWSVVEACSGVRYLIASFMVGTLFAYLNYRSTRRRLIFVGASLLVPIVANWMRAYMIVMLGHLSGNKLAVGVDHLIYGWVFFGVVIMIMFVIGARWAEPDEARVPVDRGSQSGAERPVGSWSVIVLAAVCVVVLPQLASRGLERGASEVAAPQLVLPDRFGDWHLEPDGADTWRPSFGNPSVAVARTYRESGHVVRVFVAYYRNQGPGRKLVSSQNVLATSDDRRWNVVGRGQHTLELQDRHVSFATADLLGGSVSRTAAEAPMHVWKTYWVDGEPVSSDIAAKVAGALAQLLGRGDDGAVIILSAHEDSPQASNTSLERFVRANWSQLQGLLKHTHESR